MEENNDEVKKAVTALSVILDTDDPQYLQKIPKFQDVVVSKDTAFKMDVYNMFLNKNPNPAWVKKHPLYKKDVYDDLGNKTSAPLEYIPIERIELMLTQLFQKWYVEVIEYKQLFHSVTVHIRLFYFHPVLNEWLHQDGVGAQNVQVDKDKNASDLGAIKPNAVMLALPAAKSYAIKDAAEEIGQVFGSNLNRKDVIVFKGLFSQENVEKTVNKKELDRVINHIANSRNVSELEEVRDDMEKYGDEPYGEGGTIREFYYQAKKDLK